MQFLTLIEVLELHRQVIEQSGGAFGIRDVDHSLITIIGRC